MRSPLDLFFKLGDKVTRGDLKRKSDFDYYLLWIMFLAFSFIFISNFYSFIYYVRTDWITSLKYLGWSGVMTAIMWFQYYTLKGIRMSREIQKNLLKNPQEQKEEILDSKEDMLREFK